jgi:hypothetical protein
VLAAPPSGAGQKVGLLEYDTFHQSDVVDLFTLFPGFGNLAANLSQVHVNGGASLGAGEREVLLDIVAVLSFAPGASVVVYDAPPTTSYQALFNAMINAGVTIISNSWSSCEDQVPVADIMSIDAILQTAVASGISVFNGSGDTGNTCLDGSPNTIGVPANSPNATAVGGTSLKPALGYLYGTEAWWDGTAKTPPTGQGGYGVSRFFARPAYQAAVSPGTMRSVPDVTVNADPRSGAILCQADDGGCPTGKLYGGTSMAAPVWAAFAARLNQMLGQNIGALNPVLYQLAGTEAFHTPTSMGTDFAHVGLGSPNLNRLGAALLGVSAGQVSASGSFAYYASTVLGTMEIAPLPTIPADGSTAAAVVVRLLDANGHTISGKQVQLSINAGSHAVVSPASGTTSIANGAAAFSVTDLFAETVTFTATDTSDGIVILNTAIVTFGVPSAASAGIVASPSPVASDGSSATTITVTLKDSLNRPTPGKLITLSQGNAHSIISGPSPAVTDVNGQIQFTATDNVAEVVTYTAVDVTDGDLPVPGSAPVTFTGGSTSCLTSPPTAAAGFTLTPFATGFAAQNFFYSNVNWGGCGGASNPAFDTSGNVFVSDFFAGTLSKFGLPGGAVSSGNTLATIGQTLQQPTFGKDGNFYVARAATGSGFNSGIVMRVDPGTGAVLQTLATGLTCPSPLVVDPLSGDLFFTGTCFGAGSDDPRVWRIQNPASVSPTLVVYATLPSTPSGLIAFAPNGTLYVVSNYTGTGSIIQIAGTDKSSPPAMTTLSGISSDFWLTMGEVLPSGAAKSLLVHNNNALKLVDITTNPFTTTVLVNGAIGSGTIGPDGCLYATASDRILKLAPTSGACGFVPSNPSPSLVLAPSTVSPNPSQGISQTFTATFRNTTVPAGTAVFFQITGVNAQTKLGTTDASGVASIAYTGVIAGNDKVVASSRVGNSDFASNPAFLTWGSGQHATFLTLNLSPSGGVPGQTVTLDASLADVSVAPNAPVAGATITFSLGNQTCNGVTNAQGTASCTLSILPGAITLMANFAGNGQNAPAVDSEQFRLAAPTAPPQPPPTSAAASIPTLSQWGLLIAALLLGVAGMMATRRQSR